MPLNANSNYKYVITALIKSLAVILRKMKP